MIKRINRRLRQEFILRLIKLKGYNPEDNYYIFSTNRGGSTWLMEIIYEIIEKPIINEPFQIGIKRHPLNKLNFGWRQYIPEDEKWPEAKETLDDIFSGKKLLPDCVTKKTTVSNILKSDKLLFKICRGHALLPWLVKNYNFQYKPIFLIRHPFAVASSKLRYKGWGHSSIFEIPQTPYNEVYSKHREFLKTLNTNEEVLVATWCISNLIPLRHEANNKEWITINYEELVMNPHDTIQRVLQAWQISNDLSSINFIKDSFSTKKDSPSDVKKRITNWQSHLTSDQKDRMGRILDYFEVTEYSKENPFPVKTFY